MEPIRSSRLAGTRKHNRKIDIIFKNRGEELIKRSFFFYMDGTKPVLRNRFFLTVPEFAGGYL